MTFTDHRWHKKKAKRPPLWHWHINYCFGWDPQLKMQTHVCLKCLWYFLICSTFQNRKIKTYNLKNIPFIRQKDMQTACSEFTGAITLCCCEAAVSSHKTSRTVWNPNFTLPATGFISLSCFHTIGSHQRELLFMIVKCPSASISQREGNKDNHAWFMTFYTADIYSQRGAFTFYRLEH